MYFNHNDNDNSNSNNSHDENCGTRTEEARIHS